MEQKENNPAEGVIAGRNAVAEALKSGRAIDSLYVARGDRSGSLGVLIAKAKKLGIAVKEADPVKLDHLCAGAVHQGVVAVAAAKAYATLDDIFALAESTARTAFSHSGRRAGRPPQSRRHSARRGMCGRTRRHHPEAAQRGPHRVGGQGQRGRGRVCARGARDEPCRHD